MLLVYAAIVAVGFGSIGSLLALRTGSGEAIQGLFPLLFVFLFISSMNTPRNLIAVGWFQFLASINPISYLIECVRSLIITGWDARGPRARVQHRDRARDRRGHRREPRDGKAARPIVNIWPVASGVAWRTLKNVITTPSLVIPSLMFPLLFFIAFAGGLSQVQNTPGFDYPNGYTAFQFVFVLLQSAAFGGVFTGFGVARDFEGGFARRLLLAAPNRIGIVVGYSMAALLRWCITATLLTIIALVAGMQVGGGPVDIVGLYTLAAIMNLCGFLWAAGIAMRLRTVQAGPLMQMPVFLLLFIAPVYVPLALLGDDAARVRPVQPGHLRARVGPRLPGRRSDARRARVRPAARGRDRLLGVGAPRAALGRSRRVADR